MHENEKYLGKRRVDQSNLSRRSPLWNINGRILGVFASISILGLQFYIYKFGNLLINLTISERSWFTFFIQCLGSLGNFQRIRALDWAHQEIVYKSICSSTFWNSPLSDPIRNLPKLEILWSLRSVFWDHYRDISAITMPLVVHTLQGYIELDWMICCQAVVIVKTSIRSFLQTIFTPFSLTHVELWTAWEMSWVGLGFGPYSTQPNPTQRT
jgi:hypothetical protein